MSLAEAVADPSRKSALLAAAVVELEDEVENLSGFKGKAIGAGYGAVKKARPGFVENNIERMLPRFVPVVDHHLASAREAALHETSVSVESYFASNADFIAESFLEITDERAAGASNRTAVKIYERLRGGAKDQVVSAMPRVARLADQHG